MSSRSPVERLRAYAEENGLNQYALAEKLGCKQPTVSRVLLGRKGVGIRLASAIERLTNGTIRAADWDRTREAVR